MTITLRDAVENDAAFLLEVYGSTRAQELALIDWSDEQKVAFLMFQFEAQHRFYHEQYPEATYSIILQEGQPVGRLYVLRAEDLIRILDITVLPQFRNGSIGTTLISELLNEGAQKSKPVHIRVEHFNPSLRLFERLGFSKIQEEGINWLMERSVT
jgi:ribosomal protein S18 acetylase RimI-like enzyme